VPQRSRTTRPSGFLFSSALAASLIASGAFFDATVRSAPAAPHARALLERELAPERWASGARQIATWSISSRDHAGLPFVIIDQASERVFAFTGKGLLTGSTRLLRSGEWQDAPLSPGRYTTDTWRSARAGAVVWTNADRALVLQAAAPAASQAQRMVPVALPNRGRGSAQVDGEFYRQHLQAFRSQDSVLYVLPDAFPWQRSFTVYATSAARCRHPLPPPVNQTRNLS
jgi:hypothetical protein